MSRTRPRSLNIRTPVGGIYGSSFDYSPTRRSPSRPRRRYCRNCACYPVVASPVVARSYQPVYPVSYVNYQPAYHIPLMYTPSPVHITTPLATSRFVYEEPLRLPEVPYPNYETDTLDSVDFDELRTNTEETISTMQRNMFRKSESNLIRDFEETKWMSLDNHMKDVSEWTLKRNQWFQRSVELPHGIITRLKCERLPMDETQSLKRYNMQRLKISGRVRQWSQTQKAIVEEDFSEVVMLPQGTDMSTIEYKLQSKNIHRYNEETFNSTLRHQQTSYDETEDPTFTENTCVITGRVEKVPHQETVIPTETWSKEYKQLVKGTVDLSPEGRVVNPTIHSYSELPDSLVKLAPMPDQDTTYEVLDNGCQIRIRLDRNVDRDSVKLQVDPADEKVIVVFSRHSEENTNGVYDPNSAGRKSSTTNYDMKVSQTFELSSMKFNINNTTKRIQDRDLLIYIPFAPGFHPNGLQNRR